MRDLLFPQELAILEIRKGALICPTCRRKIRGVRLLPGGSMRGVDVRCDGCRGRIIVDIDEARAVYASPRR